MLDLNSLPLDELFRALQKGNPLSRLLAIAGEEDLGTGGLPGDVTTQCSIPPSQHGDGVIVAREAGVLSGVMTLPETAMMLAAGCQISFRAQDGDTLRKGQVIAVLSGPMYQVLRAERTMLNFIGRMSGIATRTAQFARAIESTGAKLLDTRKTTPGWRALEKYAVRCGGGHLHRTGLHDAVLFKDNHIFGVPPRELPEWVRRAVTTARANARDQDHELRFVELEVDSLEQLEAVLAAGLGRSGEWLDYILLDNMAPDMLRAAVELRRKHESSVLYEASGGVTLETIRAIAETGVDLISVGGLTHHAVSLDVAMDVQHVG